MRDKNFNVRGFKDFAKGLREDELSLSQEPFYTIQGEGMYSGVASFFVRTSHCSLRCTFCSVGSTLVSTNTGKKKIRNMKVGDLVYSYNKETKQDELTKVLSVVARLVPVEDIRSVIGNISDASGHNVSTISYMTKEHRFFVKDRAEYIHIDEITSPIKILSQIQYKSKTVSSVKTLNEEQIRLLTEDEEHRFVRVYSLTVEKNSNYYTDDFLSHNCDEGTWDKHTIKYSYTDLLAKLQSLNKECKLIIFTGGEPTLQLKQSFVDFFKAEGYKINIETSGSYMNDVVSSLNFVCMSPKRLSDQNPTLDKSKDKYILQEGMIRYADEVKFIIDSNTNTEMLLELINNYRVNFIGDSQRIQWKKNCIFFVSPMDEYDVDKNEANMSKLIQLTLDNPNLFKINLQIHKLLKMP